ncbi:MAG TPA: hypothetical protein VEG84_11250 [Thermoanaerobaculia bacterium]|nr:hypothetical protein [Thermoanaerobaculia bacterium]
MSDRKYRHRGYMDSGDEDRGRRRGPSGPPRTEGAPRGRGIDLDKAVVFACKTCGEKRRDPEAVGPDATCEKCGADLHSCIQCAHFDTSARFECARPIPARIADKKKRNACTFFSPVQSFDLTGSRGSASPDDARAAFEKLFKK